MISMPNAELDFASLAVPKASQEERNKLGQDDFLMLMIEQFRNQDPFKPMENGEFIAQMAQFSQVAGIAEMNTSMDKLAGSLSANQALQAATMVDRSVLADGNVGRLEADRPLKAGVDLPFATNAAIAQIFDERGQLLREIPLGVRNAGLTTFEWDGTLADGEQAEPGNYRIAAVIRNGNIDQPLDTLVASRVQSIMLSNGGRSAQITTESGQQIGLSQVRAIL
ncbi:MAG: flagellar hook assembly protein FlgD [Gammaproteobacteria bacterium]|nr:MAG: flagellar hook assembly protein FlgD [Gammaproteobacteria bacterium]